MTPQLQQEHHSGCPSLEDLYALHFHTLYTFFRGKVHGHELAEDLVQNTFLRLLRTALEPYQNTHKEDSLVWKVANAALVDHIRHECGRSGQRQRVLGTPTPFSALEMECSLSTEDFLQHPHAQPDPTGDAADVLLLHDLEYNELRRLFPDTWLPFYQHYFGRIPLDQLAREEGVDSSTISQRFGTMVRRLRDFSRLTPLGKVYGYVA